MSNIHVLTDDGRGKVSVVMHFAVPDADNAVGVNWRAALVNSGVGGSSSMTVGAGAGQILQPEVTQIELGAVYEHRATFPLESAGTGAPGQQAALRALYTREKAAEIAGLQRRLKYFGHTESQS